MNLTLLFSKSKRHETQCVSGGICASVAQRTTALCDRRLSTMVDAILISIAPFNSTPFSTTDTAAMARCTTLTRWPGALSMCNE
ncbi:hypothetical protein PIB30_007228 [Stylosanthes scabra]|uniref:Uncharacterized protein n=1 Tax=Stylosanthes scabra TaxID=79078 RepID=A0ABU6V7L2_9FABA|nr:hypothetical protein [Stylosanthes scabra]